MVLRIDKKMNKKLSSDAKNYGRHFEHVFRTNLEKIGIFDRIVDENYLTKKWGWHATSVDFMGETENGIVLIQIKYRRTRRRETAAVQNFIKSVKWLCGCVGKPMLFGLWVSRLDPFEDNKELMKQFKIDIISHYDSIEGLVQRAMIALLEKNIGT